MTGRSAAAAHRTVANDIAPFAIVRTMDGRIETAWLSDDIDPGPADPGLAPDLAARLEAWFAGEPVDDFGVAIPTTPPFFSRCWAACRAIPRGSTRSYAGLAEAAGDRRAVRAAGQAMRRNPLPVIVPCHRVVNQRGGLHGYGGDQAADGPGLRIKQALLALEGAGSPDLWSASPAAVRGR